MHFDHVINVIMIAGSKTVKRQLFSATPVSTDRDRAIFFGLTADVFRD